MPQWGWGYGTTEPGTRLPASPPPPPQPRGNRQASSGQPFLSASSFPHSGEEGRPGPCMSQAPQASWPPCPYAHQVHAPPTAHHHPSFFCNTSQATEPHKGPLAGTRMACTQFPSCCTLHSDPHSSTSCETFFPQQQLLQGLTQAYSRVTPVPDTTESHKEW